MQTLQVLRAAHQIAAAEPPQLLPAREQMAFTLGFHIILVPFGVALTAMMLVANYRGIRRDDAMALRLARRWSQVAAVLFAVGAVSGTVLSFELGLLWPNLIGTYGPAFGIPFAIEGLFFFIEAIFVSVYIYGWQRLPPWLHFWTGVPVVIAGIGGTLSVVAANAWMNQPAGFTMRGGKIVDVHPVEVIFNDAFGYEAAHMLLAAYMVAGFSVAGVYAVGMLRGRRDHYHRLGLLIALTVAAVATPAQVLVGDIAAREVYQNEPAKFAAIEALAKTDTQVPEVLHDDGRWWPSKVLSRYRDAGGWWYVVRFSTRPGWTYQYAAPVERPVDDPLPGSDDPREDGLTRLAQKVTRSGAGTLGPIRPG